MGLRPVTPEVVVSPDTDRELWLKERRAGLGGSDAAAALGLNPYLSPFTLWLDKTGQLTDEVEENEAMLMGKLLEPVIIKRYSTAHPEQKIHASPGLLRHPEIPFLLGTPDALIDEDGVLEAKAPGYDFAKEWDEDELPVRHRLQTYHYGILTGRTFGVVAAIIGGQRYEERPFEFSQDSADKYVERLDQWWTRHIVIGDPPDIDASESTTAALKALYDAYPGAVAYLPSDALQWAIRYWEEHAAAEAAKTRKDLAGNHLRQLLGNAEIGLTENDEAPVATWKESLVSRFNEAAHKTAHPDCHARFTRAVPQRTLRPTKKFN